MGLGLAHGPSTCVEWSSESSEASGTLAAAVCALATASLRLCACRRRRSASTAAAVNPRLLFSPRSTANASPPSRKACVRFRVRVRVKVRVRAGVRGRARFRVRARRTCVIAMIPLSRSSKRPSE